MVSCSLKNPQIELPSGAFSVPTIKRGLIEKAYNELKRAVLLQLARELSEFQVQDTLEALEMQVCACAQLLLEWLRHSALVTSNSNRPRRTRNDAKSVCVCVSVHALHRSLSIVPTQWESSGGQVRISEGVVSSCSSRRHLHVVLGIVLEAPRSV